MSRVALVTGASRGIGRAVALQLARDGYQVAITDLASQKEAAENTVKEISALGVKSLYIQADSSKRSDIYNAVDITHKELGGFNTIVNNAGIAQIKPIVEVTEEELQNINNINIGGVLWGIQAAAKKFQELKQKGKIINCASIVGFDSFPLMSTYSASKWAVRGLTQSAAKELAKDKITVNNYCPGIVLTPMWDKIDDEMGKFYNLSKGETLKKYSAGIALGRSSEPEDVANLVSFLGSDKSDYVTGQSLIVDGGIVFT
jgi:meso-butanediol dehydrogenase/(S,S)-butanediol dehydrogenase/diacetyl reductase